MNMFQQVAAQLLANGQQELAAMVLKGDAVARSICQAYNNASTPTMIPAALPSPSTPTPGGGGCGAGGCGFPPPPPSGGCAGGCGCGGSCGVGNGGGKSPGNGACTVGAPLCGTSGPLGCGAPVPVPIPVGGCPIPPGSVPACSQVGDWNCRAVDGDLAPCDIEEIERQEKLLSFSGTLAGALADNAEIAVLIIPVGVAHELCVELLQVTVTDDMGVTTALTISEVAIQAERIYQNGDGSYTHAWTYQDPERPEYLEVKDGRCRCANLCACVTPEGRSRMVFRLPEAVPMGDTLNVTIWGRRCNWLLQNGCKTSQHNANGCGPCPPCAVCNHVELTNAELTATADVLYAVV